MVLAVENMPEGAQLVKLQSQMQVWREDLLALDRRQKLLYFQHPKVGSFEFLLPKMAELEAWLESGPVNLVSNEPDVEDSASASVLGLLTGRKWHVATVQDKNEAQILSTCKRLLQRSEQEFADRGVWILYIGLGMLNWIDPADQKQVCSPLKLVPVRLEKSGSRYTMRRTGDEAVLNSSLALAMARDFNIDMPSFEDSDFTVGEVIDGVKQVIAGEPGWSVDPRSILMTFTFHKEAMYQDLIQNEEQILASGLIQALALGPSSGEGANFAFELADGEQLDELVPPETLHSILDADASQRKCIIAAREGRSFVMDGPPGTGKSQTIANIIAELMAVGKTVLFVSEKAAALDVVRDRLASRNLEPFLLELHSHKATRKQVVTTLNKELTQKPIGRSNLDQADLSLLESSRLGLSEYAAAMNETRHPLGRSFHNVLGRLLQLGGPGDEAGGAAALADYPVGDSTYFTALTPELLAEIKHQGGALARAWRPALEQEDFIWRGLAGEQLDAGSIRDCARSAGHLSELSQQLAEESLRFDGKLPFLDLPRSRTGVEQRNTVVRLLAHRPTIPDAWLTGPFVQVEQRVNQWRKSLALRGELLRVLGSEFTKWTPEDHKILSSIEAFAAYAGAIPVHASLQNATVEAASGLGAKINAINAEIQQLLPEAHRLADLFQADSSTLSLRTLSVLCSLAQLSQAGHRPEADWLDPAVHGDLEESTKVLANAVGAVREKQAQLQNIFTPQVLGLDLKALHWRFENEHTGFFSRWSQQARADRTTLRPVTVSGGVNRAVIAALPIAIAWQDAQRELYAAERIYGPRLKSYYQGLQTDFSRVHQALELAQRAAVVAGKDVGLQGLAAQLSTNTEPDRLLMPIANKLTAGADKLKKLMGETLDSDFQLWAAEAPLNELLQVSVGFADQLTTAEPALARLNAMGAKKLMLRQAAENLSRIARLVEIDAANDAVAAADSELLGHHFAGLATPWPVLEQDLVWCRAARSNLNAPLDGAALEILGEFSGVELSLQACTARWDNGLAELARWFEDDRVHGLTEELGRDVAGTVGLAAEMDAEAATDIDVWFEYKRIRQWAAAHGLGETAAGLEKAAAPAADIPGAFERGALEPWAEAIISGDTRLAEYRPGNRNARVEEFSALDAKLIKYAYSSVVEACTARRPRSSFGAAAIIVREAEKKSRHKPIRTLLEQTGDVAQALKPCFMMSPLSVSQYLPGSMRFDVVIFDEASQVMPADAVNCIYRGNQLIIAGDQKQLPPTAFFTTTAEESDDELAPDNFDSVLDLCKASGAITSLPLTWHYRSLHEDLITYSNYGFYDGKLNTFPGAVQNSLDLGVHHEFVNGVYQRGKGAMNPIEAERVVDRIIEHRRNNSGLSLGVVTFSTAQADAIFDAIDRRSVDEPALTGLLDDRDRLHGFFVKNLESVQGDERDIIIFSVGYGPDASGHLAMNFGPLTRKGGQRRLNVAITRARRRVEIVSSFHASQMREGNSEGNFHLRNYLDFASRGTAALAHRIAPSHSEGDFLLEGQVRKSIEALGYETLSRVGSAKYRVDIGVKHPHKPGTFLLGVECDGVAYSSAKTARDRDRLRGSVLQNLGWNMFRVWGLGWYRDPVGQVGRLQQALEEALMGSPVKGGQQLADSEEPGLDFEAVDLLAAPSWSIAYQQARHLRTSHDVAAGSPEALPELVEFCQKVIAAEAPLHLDTLQARLRETWGMGRVGSRIKENLLEAVAQSIIADERARLDNDDFIRLGPPGAVHVRHPGASGVNRKAGAIPPEELDEAVRLVLRDAVGLSGEQILTALRSIFSWARSGPEIQAAVSKSLYRCQRNGVCTKDRDGIYRLGG
ncbi:DUF3320 domain-containing protein [Arthrobacter antibioticus]|uniref:DUF3320 domain-containing protein n=1 Tax=Arthrobacter sp. H35-MC1 TaxID=3046203 RepID=UPI0024BAF258|nr:DUF3320 domain-containing protein [Arthrobacter sp. H35-MC1]MDJ0317305.1 DUF3320 domain-containing protein [Arthrobacter sp. H35-MC1]